MSRVVAGTLLLPNGQPMANASIYFTAKRTEPVSIIEGSNTFFNTNAAGVYNQSVVNGFYAVSIQYIADASGAHTRRWQLGDVFIETGASTTLEALIIASNVPDDIALGVFYEILADAQQAAEDAQNAAAAAQASAEAAEDAAASVSIGTGPAQVPNNTILDARLGTTGNLGTAAQRTVGTAGANISDNTQLNVRLATTGNLGTAAQRTVGTAGANISDNTQLNVRLGTSGNLGSLATQNANAVAVSGGSAAGLSALGISGNQIFDGAGRRIKGDMSTATLADRLMVQTSVAGGATNFAIIPDNAGTAAGIQVYSSATVADSARLLVTCTNTTAAITSSNANAGGAFVPLVLQIGGTTRATFNTTGEVGIGVVASTHKLEVAGGIYASGGFTHSSFTKTTVPSAAANIDTTIVVTNATLGRNLYLSDGTNWRDPARNILS